MLSKFFYCFRKRDVCVQIRFVFCSSFIWEFLLLSAFILPDYCEDFNTSRKNRWGWFSWRGSPVTVPIEYTFFPQALRELLKCC